MKDVQVKISGLADDHPAQKDFNKHLDENMILVDAELENMIKKLSQCTFLPGSFDKRFVRSLSSKEEGDKISLKQKLFIEKLFYKYRRQTQGAIK